MPGLRVPDRIPFENLSAWVDQALPAESPVAFGLQPSADIGVRSDLTDVLLKVLNLLLPCFPSYTKLLQTLVEMQGRSASGSAAAVGMTREEKVKVVLDDILEKLPENFDIQGVLEYTFTPLLVVSILNSHAQASGREGAIWQCFLAGVLLYEHLAFYNAKLPEIIRPCTERRYLPRFVEIINSHFCTFDHVQDITFTDALESTMMSLFNEQVPAAWRKVAYPIISYTIS
jgi:hypothetical protein